MSTWSELRTVALVGTERRALPPPATGSLLEALPADAGAEQTALHAAALLGIARRTGGAAGQTAPPPPCGESPTPEQEAPHAAVQLLELMLTGNAGPGKMSDTLVTRWFDRCNQLEMVVPHRLLVPVLDYANFTAGVRDAIAPAIGHRGRWLAAQRKHWNWALAHSAPGESTAITKDLDELLEMPAGQRDANLAAIRAHDAALGRDVIAEACTRLDAATRARVLGLLVHELGPDDEELLEAALDDRSKAVRAKAIGLLNRLPTSDRAARLARSIEPLVESPGRLRPLRVRFPDPPSDEQQRDLAADGHGVIEQQWFQTLVVGTPLTWWEAHLQMTPSKIVDSKFTPRDELLAAWIEATLNQRNAEWAAALFAKTKAPELTRLVGSDAAADAFLTASKDKTATRQLNTLLHAVPGPWDASFSKRVLDWARKSDGGKGAQARMNTVQTVLADNLDPSLQPDLERWLNKVRGEEHKPLQRALRNVIQQLSFRTSIDKAFA